MDASRGIANRARAPALVLALVAFSAAGTARAEEGGDFGTFTLWEVSGITGPAEAYENQLAMVFAPGVRLGRVLRVPRLLEALRVDLELQLQLELAGNDARFRGSQFSSPALLPGGAEAIAINDTGQVAGVASGQVDGTGRRALLSDLWLGLSHPTLYRIPYADVDVGGRLSLTFPTSPSSRATGLYAALGVGFDLSRTLWRRWEIAYGFRHTQYFYRYATNDVSGLGGEVEVNGRMEPVYQPQRGTVLNPSFGFVNELSTSVEIAWGLSASASYALINTFTHPLPEVADEGLAATLADPCRDGPAVADAVGGEVIRCGERAQRDSHWFQLHLAYRALPMLSIHLGVSTLQPVRHEGVGISNPLIQTAPTTNYTTVELGVRADLERTAASVWRLARPHRSAP